MFPFSYWRTIIFILVTFGCVSYVGESREIEGLSKALTAFSIWIIVSLTLLIDRFIKDKPKKLRVYLFFIEYGLIYLLSMTSIKILFMLWGDVSWDQAGVLTFILPYKFIVFIAFIIIYRKIKKRNS